MDNSSTKVPAIEIYQCFSCFFRPIELDKDSDRFISGEIQLCNLKYEYTGDTAILCTLRCDLVFKLIIHLPRANLQG